MRLIDVTTMKVVEFHGSTIPPYAILSHRWSSDEVDYKDFQKGRNTSSLGYRKVQSFCKVVEQHIPSNLSELRHVWVDTCCIDGRSSAELSEAINSMFTWYQRASVACVHLATVDISMARETCVEQFRTSEWFRRGWTLQELLAPRYILFFDANWTLIGTLSKMLPRRLARGIMHSHALTGKPSRAQLAKNSTAASWKHPMLDPTWSLWHDVAQCTNLRVEVLLGKHDLDGVSVAEKMSWLAERITTREEDMSYCMLGILGIHLPLLYGEGPHAFIRLQEELVRSTNDESLFSWPASIQQPWILASSPESFAECQHIRPLRVYTRLPYSMTNQGLELRLRSRTAVICPKAQGHIHDDIAPDDLILPLNCGPRYITDGATPTMIKLEAQTCGHYDRIPVDQVEATSLLCDNNRLMLENDLTIYVHASMDSYETCKRAAADARLQGDDFWTKALRKLGGDDDSIAKDSVPVALASCEKVPGESPMEDICQLARKMNTHSFGPEASRPSKTRE